MFTQQDLRELAAYQARTPVLSIYLNVDPMQSTTEEYRLALRQLLKQVEGTAAQEDVLAVTRYFDHQYDWSGRGIVVFSCQDESLWRVVQLEVPVASGATVARKPYVWPLAALMDAYGSYVVALVDQRGIRLLHFELGQLRSTNGREGEDVRKLKSGRGSSAGAGRRGGAPVSDGREQEVVLRNLRESVDAAARFCQKIGPQRLVLAGAEKTLSMFREGLPKDLLSIVVGSFSAEFTAGTHEIQERSLEVLRESESAREQALVQAVFTAAAKGRGGAIRLADTLGAAHEGRIQTLVIAREYHEKGYQCANCDYITDQNLQTCPFCGGSFEEISDAAESLVTKVIEDGGKVEVVDHVPLISKFGVGALLRY
jgi:rubrerythrin